MMSPDRCEWQKKANPTIVIADNRGARYVYGSGFGFSSLDEVMLLLLTCICLK